MQLQEKNFAYIDGANLHKGITDLGWKLDYKRFRVWLKEKYNVVNAYLFIGFVAKNKNLYTYLPKQQMLLFIKEAEYTTPVSCYSAEKI